jgi:hypothetical protein
MNARVHKVKVVKALLGPDAGLLGAGVLVEEMVLAKQNLKIKNQISK